MTQSVNRIAGMTLAAAGTLVGANLAQAESVFVLEDVGTSQQLSQFDSNTPGSLSGRVSVSGLGAGESLLGIDFRPLTGELYGLSSGDSIYTINTTSGSATQVGSGFTDAPDGSFFGFDFNPVIDRIRIVSNTNTNFVANPITGDANAATTTSVFFGPGDANEGTNPNLIGHGYTNSVANAGSTELYAIDSNLDILVTQANNAGTLGTVGSLGVDIVDIGEFDISGTTGNAYLAAIPNGETESFLYQINLTTGAATSLGAIGDGLTIAGIAVGGGNDAPSVIPTPAALPAGLALMGFLVARRRKTAADASVA